MIISFHCRTLLASLFSLVISFQAHAIDTIIYPWFEGEFKEDNYYLALLTLALESSKEQFGDYELKQAALPMFQNRAILEIQKKQNLDIVWTMTSQQREQALDPIRVPLLMGLGGYRIFLINKGEQQKFSQITSAEQLQELYAGQGNNWPDSSILRNNDYNLITAAGHVALFNMLQKKRFDYMPRALHEPWNEMIMFNGLQVETSLALHYPSPYYFFVNKDNQKLKQRIEAGFQSAKKNGSFKRLFDTHPVTHSMSSMAKLESRTIFKLTNLSMTKETRQVINQNDLFLQVH